MLTHVIILTFFALSKAMQANITIDHDDNEVLYIPNDAWDISSSSCHRSIHSQNAAFQLSFRGIALYLYSIPQPLFLNLSFSLDGLPLSPYAQIPTDPLVLAQTALPNTFHTLRVDVAPDSIFLFDQLVYTVDSTPVLRIQPRQATATDNSTQSSLTATSIPNQSSQEQIGAIAGAIAASVGITSLFSLGLAISIIKIRRQRLRVRRQRQAELERTQGLSLHLPPSSTASASARVPLPRYTHPPPNPTAVLDPPPMYDSVMRLTNRNSTVLAQLPPIEEVSTIRSSQASRLSRREPSSLDEVPDNPPGLSTVADHPSVETIRASQDASRPSEHHHQS